MTLLCPICSSEQLKVTDSRPDQGDGVRRKRKCLKGHVFYTIELVDDKPLTTRKQIDLAEVRQLRALGYSTDQLAIRVGVARRSIERAERKSRK